MKFKRKLQSQSNAATTNSSDLFRREAFAILRQAISKLSPSWVACIPLTAILVVVWGCAANAAAPEPLTIEKLHGIVNTIWILIASILVIFMNAGFCMLETGFCRQKNAVNVLSKNLIVFAIATLTYWAFGFAFMFGGDGPFMGFSGFFLNGDPATYDLKPFPEGLPVPAFFLFEVAFAGTAATIVSGAVAERIQYRAFLIFSALLVGFSYSITGHWVWCSGGWLKTIGFHDFAGSTVVHCVGGFAALMGAAILGPRMGKYQDGQPTAMPGHNMSIATLGCLILWIGWFGFNPGSQLTVNEHIPYIALTTNLAAASGGLTSTIASWLKDEKPDLSMTINGILAGLVAITASCNNVSYLSAVIIGGVGGILVVFAVGIFDTVLKVDDPVGATSVHLVNGIWGTLAVGIFDMDKAGIAQFGIQLLGILSVGGFTVLLSTVFWFALKQTIGIRVSPEAEKKGLDIGEHGMEAYSGFLKDTRIL